MKPDQKGRYDAPLWDADCRDQIAMLIWMILAFTGFAFGVFIGRGL